MINNGDYFFDDKETYPLYKYYKNDQDYDELIELLLNSSYTLKEIAEKLEIGYSTVKKINAGTLRNGLYPTYPIRKKNITELKAEMVKDMLLNTCEDFQTIADNVKVSISTVRRINNGDTHHDDTYNYPLRSL